MKRLVPSMLIALVAVTPSTLTAQDTASTKRLSPVDRTTLNWFTAPNTLRLYAPKPAFIVSSTRSVDAPAFVGPKTDMGVQPGCPMPRIVPDTSRVTAMPRARVDTTIDVRMRVEVACGRK